MGPARSRKDRGEGRARDGPEERNAQRMGKDMSGEKTRVAGSGTPKAQGKGRSTWSWVFEFAGERRVGYVLSVVLAVCNVVCLVLPYFVMAQVVRGLFAGTRDFGFYVARLLVMGALWVGAAIFHALSTSSSHKATFHVLGTMRKRACDKLARMPLGDVMARSSGSLKNVLVERIDSVEPTLAHVIPEFTSNLLGPVMVLVYLFVLDWRMALVSLVTVPVGLVCMAGMFKDYDKNNQLSIEKTKALNDVAVEYIGGIEVIKVFGKTKSSYERFVRAAREAANVYVSWMRRCNAFFSAAMSVMPATLVAVLPAGLAFVRAGSLAPETFIMCVVLSLGLVGPVIAVMSYSDDLAALDAIMGEVTSIITAPEQERPALTAKMPEGGTVTLEGVSFGYGDSEVLHGIDLTIREGQTTALVGPSGSGKSTIARLIGGLWDTDAGAIRIGGIDVREISADDLGKLVSYVSQNNYLFMGTVRENIRMGREGATDEDVERVAQAAGCHEFIMGLERGYDTVVGSGGGQLSGGERQRICIARAMLKDAPIVILDEATAYTDPENEAIIEESVGRMVRGKTLIVIAHRLSTIQGADHIVVIDEGRIAQEGTHESLLAQGGLYARMWEAHVSARDGLADGAGAARGGGAA